MHLDACKCLSWGLALHCLLPMARTGDPVPGDALYYVTDLGDLLGGTVGCFPTAINEVGQITGDGPVEGYTNEAFLWDAVDGMIGLGALANDRPYSTGADVNNAAHVVGVSDVTVDGEAGREAFLWTPEDGMVGLGVLPGGWLHSSSALGINDLEQVVGRSISALGDEAFLWDADNGMVGLGDLPGGQFLSQARDINNAGQVVGLSVSALRGVEAFIWDAEHGMCDV